MVKFVTKHKRCTPALPTSKSSQNSVDTLKGKTNPRTRGVAITKKSPITHSRSLSTDTNVPKSIKTRSSSVKNVATASEVGSSSGAGDASAAGWMSRSRKCQGLNYICELFISTKLPNNELTSICT